MGLTVLEATETHYGKRPGNALCDLVGRQPEVFRPEGHLVAHHRGDQLIVGVLEDEPAVAACLETAVVGSGGVEDAHGARIGMQESACEQQQRALAAAISTGEGNHLTGTHAQGDVVEHQSGTVMK